MVNPLVNLEPFPIISKLVGPSETLDLEEITIPFFSILVQEPVPVEQTRIQWIATPNNTAIDIPGNDNLGATADTSDGLALPPANDTQPVSTDSTETIASQGVRLTESPEPPVIARPTHPTFETNIVKQTANVIQTELLTNNQSTQSITVRLSPENLGTLHIQIDVFPDQVSAQILATESTTADLLGRGKNSLEDLLLEFGFDGANVDVSHGSLPQEFDSNQNEHSPLEHGEINHSANENIAANTTIDVFVGLNLVV